MEIININKVNSNAHYYGLNDRSKRIKDKYSSRGYYKEHSRSSSGKQHVADDPVTGT